jgi:membrane fusion protein (multidrug efflux system)
MMIFAGGLLAGGCTKEQALAPAPVQEVAVVTVKPQEVVLTTELPGRVSAVRTAEIRPQVNGLLQKRLFTEGADVKQGDALYQIDPAPYEAALESAKAALGRATANLPAIRSRAERYKELLQEKAVSQQDHDDAAAAREQAEADIRYWEATVRTAQINLEYTRVTAPISGRIGRSGVTEGAIVIAYQPAALATIQQLDPIYVDVPQSTAELLRLKARVESGRLDEDAANQKKVRVVLEDGAPYEAEGTLQFQDISVDPTTGSVILRVVFPNPQGVLLPGMFVRAVVKEGLKKDAVLVPQQSVSRDPKGNPTVLVVNAEGKVEQRNPSSSPPLVIDRAIGDEWLVASGIAPGDLVIVEGTQKVRPGVSVQVVPFGASKTN